ncbi:hypothetical protein Pan258_11660 [Symmachiella dynata]|uniref:hypothetical protein n=1 Tax=Symmachiella dynata TaxID=2527995 RepID=UPI0011888B63|nr:hypothetical protein [Symmachiella dynata]QDT47135.1 hypothetical protein Pan258_11660 [Symmachiella dynata]
MTSEIPDKLMQLLAGNDENLVYGVWELINDQYAWYWEKKLPDLGSPLRVIGDIQEADFHIGEAGMYCLLTGETADLTSIPGSFDAVGAFEAAELIRKTYSTVPEELIKSDSSVRQEAIPEPDIKDPIGAGGELTFAYLLQYHDSLIALLAKYMRDNHAALVPLFENSGSDGD